MSKNGESLMWPSNARLIMGAIHDRLGHLHGQMLGMAAEWSEGGIGARAQFVRNMRTIAKELAREIEMLDTEIYVPTPDAPNPSALEVTDE